MQYIIATGSAKPKNNVRTIRTRAAFQGEKQQQVEKTFRALCFAVHESEPGSFGTTFFFDTAEAFKQVVQAIADSL